MVSSNEGNEVNSVHRQQLYLDNMLCVLSSGIISSLQQNSLRITLCFSAYEEGSRGGIDFFFGVYDQKIVVHVASIVVGF